jgi:UDP-sugar transporter A1/2/3
MTGTTPGTSKKTKTLIVAGVLTLVTSSQGIFTTASKVDGKYEYNFGTIVLLAEAFKLLFSLYNLRKELIVRPDTQMTKDWSTMSLFLVPSFIYLAQNNVQFLFLKYVDPSSYQMLGNLKIASTGILFRFFLKRNLTNLKWIALLILLIGATTSQLDTCSSKLLSAPIEGYLFGLLSASLSGFAAVYTEFIMKKNNDSLYWQNAQLYFFGVIFNFINLTYQDVHAGFHHGFWMMTPFKGYNMWTCLVVCTLSSSGLLVSWIMKYADSIVKVYATSMAMLVTMVVSIFLFAQMPSLQLVLGVLTATASLQMYYMNQDNLIISQKESEKLMLRDVMIDSNKK